MPPETLVILLALAGFGLLHSLTAAPGIKHTIRARMGDRAYLGLYRLLYNAVSGVTFLPIVALLALRPGPTIWALHGLPAALMLAVQLVALAGLALAALQIDGQRFLGLRQARAWLSGDPLPLPPEPLIQHGVYGLVRHPLYLFVILYLWAKPQVNAAWLGLAIGSTVYFIIGAWLEECRMVREFGPEYRAYQRRVPWMIPFLHLPTPRCSPADPTPDRG